MTHNRHWLNSPGFHFLFFHPLSPVCVCVCVISTHHYCTIYASKSMYSGARWYCVCMRCWSMMPLISTLPFLCLLPVKSIICHCTFCFCLPYIIRMCRNEFVFSFRMNFSLLSHSNISKTWCGRIACRRKMCVCAYLLLNILLSYVLLVWLYVSAIDRLKYLPQWSIFIINQTNKFVIVHQKEVVIICEISK